MRALITIASSLPITKTANKRNLKQIKILEYGLHMERDFCL